MGVSELREAFNAVAAPRFTCQRALLDYARDGTAEWQILTFSGIAADGSAFDVKSERIKPGGDVVVMARDTANKLLGDSPA